DGNGCRRGKGVDSGGSRILKKKAKAMRDSPPGGPGPPSSGTGTRASRRARPRLEIRFPSTYSAELPSETTNPLFFQAEDGIRDRYVTGVQTCALPILPPPLAPPPKQPHMSRPVSLGSESKL